MRIEVKTLPVRDIMQDIAEGFNVKVKNGGGDLTIEVPEKLGEGFIRGSSFDSGMGIISYYCKFNCEMEICFSQSSIHPLKFIFCSEGQVAHRFEKSDEVHTIDPYQNIIVSSSGYNGHILKFKADVLTHVSSLEIIRSEFSLRSNYEFRDLDPTLKEVFQDAVSEKQFYYQGNYSIKAADIMADLNNNNYSGFLRSLYLEAKALMMLVIQVSQYEDDESDDRLPTILRQSDVQKVDYVTKKILEDLGNNPTVEHLAKEAGTNVNKLQEGFKYVYDLTVNKYIQHQKLEAAKKMLINSEKNISEIVTAIGLNNRSYFSKIFKEKYGVNPKYFLKTRKTGSSDKNGD